MEGSCGISQILVVVVALSGCQAGPLLHLHGGQKNEVGWGGLAVRWNDASALLTDARDWKIVGGTELSPNERPYLVMVQAVLGGVKYQNCGGSVIDEWHVLSAAHCFQDPNYQYAITAGDHDQTEEEAADQFREVEKVFNHPEYHSTYILNDIAVLRLASPLDLSTSEVSPISLNSLDACPEDYASCSVIGWGRTTEGGLVSQVPLKLSMAVWPQIQCTGIYSQFNYGDNQICAGGKGGEGACHGDSGGPLVCECGGVTSNVGIVSYGVNGCASDGYPDVFTRVSSYLPWIRSITAEKRYVH